jgi:hypothetical protein
MHCTAVRSIDELPRGPGLCQAALPGTYVSEGVCCVMAQTPMPGRCGCAGRCGLDLTCFTDPLFLSSPCQPFFTLPTSVFELEPGPREPKTIKKRETVESQYQHCALSLWKSGTDWADLRRRRAQIRKSHERHVLFCMLSIGHLLQLAQLGVSFTSRVCARLTCPSGRLQCSLRQRAAIQGQSGAQRA